MNYVSTRGGMQPQTFSQILLEGLAPDGGLSIPDTLPEFDLSALVALQNASYAEVAYYVLRHFITDIPAEDLRSLVDKTYTQEAFSTEAIVPIKPLYPSKNCYLVGLSEGPTLAFKDMAMQFLGNLFEYVLQKENRSLIVLGATSGDTGSAAEYALRGKKGVAVVMLSPHGRMSPFQRAQMFSLPDANIHNIAIEGVFDDCQDIVKQVSEDLGFKSQFHIGAVNSINWGRIAAQVVYYVYAWLKVPKATHQPLTAVDFTVPSGNFGNVLAGHIAKMMGLPIRRLVVATNENRVLEEFFTTGIYRPRSAAQTHLTSSPSMDISKASNFERFIYHLLGNDGNQVSVLWRRLAEQGFFDLSHLLPQIRHAYSFRTGNSTHSDRLQTIQKVYEQTRLYIDPHTADGVKVAESYADGTTPMLILETALPTKFEQTITEALGHIPPRPAHLQGIEGLPQRVEVMRPSVDAVKAYIRSHYPQGSV